MAKIKDFLSQLPRWVWGAEYYGTFKFRVMVLVDYMNSEKYIRVRDEGHRVTMTIKNNLTDKFPVENEIIINDFDEGINLLLALHCKKKYYYENSYHFGSITGGHIINRFVNNKRIHLLYTRVIRISRFQRLPRGICLAL